MPPTGIVVDSDGTVYVADGNHRIQRFSADGTFLGKWGSYGSDDGQFNSPSGLTVAPDGTIYVADSNNHRIQRFLANGTFLGKWGSEGSGDGQFSWPTGIAVGSDGTVYVVDSGNHRIQRFSANGTFLGKWGSEGSGNGQFNRPAGIATASDGTVYVVDSSNHRIQRFSASGTFLGKWGSEGSGNGQFQWPVGIAVTPIGTVYIADAWNHRVQQFDAIGTFLNSWGSMGTGMFDSPFSVAVASDGTLYVADTGHHRIVHLSAYGLFLGEWGSYGSGPGQFIYPQDVAVAPNGIIYVVESPPGNSRVQYFSPAGNFLGEWTPGGNGITAAPDGTIYVVTDTRVRHYSATGTLLGEWGSEGSGDREFYMADGIAMGSGSTLYVADSGNCRIQRFSADGTFLGKWGSCGSGDGQFGWPRGIAAAPDGTVYVAELNNCRVQHFTATGTFLGKWGFQGRGAGQFFGAADVAVAADGTVYVADPGYYRIQAFGTSYPSVWRGEFFGNDWLAEPPLAILHVLALNFDWADSAPASGVPADHFTDRWQRYIYFQPGSYQFTLTADDGVRFWVDDRLLLDEWYNYQRNTYTMTLSLTEGYHRLLVEHWDKEGKASLFLSFAPYTTPTPTPTHTPSPTPILTPTPSPTPGPVQRPWTFILYLDGDNNLYPYLDRAIRRLEAQPPNPNANILVLFDGDRNNDSWRFLVQPGGNYTLGVNKWYMGELNMGSPDTLRNFITWARENFPAQHYYLAIANHGRGTSGISWDDTNSRDYLTVSELRTALQQATNSGQWKIDVLHYDACLMALLENAYQVKDYANFLVASQNLGWSVFAYEAYAQVQNTQNQAPPAPYEFAAVAAKVTASTTPQQLAIDIADAYFNHPAIRSYPRTISALDLNRAEAVRQAVDTFSSALRNNLNTIKTYLQNARSATQKFDSRDYYKITDDDEYLDLYHLAQRVKQYVSNSEVQAAAQGVIDALNSGFVVVEHHQSGMWGGEEELYWDLDNAHGVSIYFPPRSGSSDYNKYISHQLFRFTADGQWDDFLVDYFGALGLPPESPTEPELPPMLAPEYKIYLPLVLKNY